jgi:hypothetical protein
MILSGSLNRTDLSPPASLHFEHDGTMRLVMSDEIDSHDAVSIMLVSEYLQYALSKTLWMSEFVNMSIDGINNQIDDSYEKHKKKPHLRVIDGGKCTTQKQHD